MIDAGYLYKGLCGLARAHQANAMAGHLGAAVVAGYFFGEDHCDLDSKVHAGIQTDLDRIIRGEESVWYDSQKAGITIPEMFQPLPGELARTGQIPTIAEALAGNIGKTRQSGHNVIFAAIGLRALHGHPEHATASIVEGIRKLIERFDGEGPGRGYYGKQRGWVAGDKVSLSAADDLPPYDSERTMAHVVMDDLIESASVRRQGFGGLFHIINHAAALTELSRFGYPDLARKGFAAHRHHLRLWRSLPDVAGEFGALKHAEHDPRTPEYWSRTSTPQWSAHLTHRIKTLYGFYTLVRFVDDPAKRKKAEERFLYLMA